jgi:hypothetical protein
MEDAMNPSENQDPLNKQNPLDDSLLDSLEHSIENPPGFTDPLAEQDKQLMDDLSRQLDAVESSIESAPPSPPAHETANGEDEQDTNGDETAEYLQRKAMNTRK